MRTLVLFLFSLFFSTIFGYPFLFISILPAMLSSLLGVLHSLFLISNLYYCLCIQVIDILSIFSHSSEVKYSSKNISTSFKEL